MNVQGEHSSREGDVSYQPEASNPMRDIFEGSNAKGVQHATDNSDNEGVSPAASSKPTSTDSRRSEDVDDSQASKRRSIVDLIHEFERIGDGAKPERIQHTADRKNDVNASPEESKKNRRWGNQKMSVANLDYGDGAAEIKNDPSDKERSSPAEPYQTSVHTPRTLSTVTSLNVVNDDLEERRPYQGQRHTDSNKDPEERRSSQVDTHYGGQEEIARSHTATADAQRTLSEDFIYSLRSDGPSENLEQDVTCITRTKSLPSVFSNEDRLLPMAVQLLRKPKAKKQDREQRGPSPRVSFVDEPRSHDIYQEEAYLEGLIKQLRDERVLLQEVIRDLRTERELYVKAISNDK